MNAPKVLLLLAAAVLPATTSRPPFPPALLRTDAPALDIRTSIEPVTQDEYLLRRRVRPEMFRCRAAVYPAPEGKPALMAKDIVIGPGESDETTAVIAPFTIEFKAKIAGGLDQAETTVTVLRDGAIVNRQKSTIWLQRETATVEPVR
jgi:hypothetical protein